MAVLRIQQQHNKLCMNYFVSEYSGVDLGCLSLTKKGEYSANKLYVQRNHIVKTIKHTPLFSGNGSTCFHRNPSMYERNLIVGGKKASAMANSCQPLSRLLLCACECVCVCVCV